MVTQNLPSALPLPAPQRHIRPRRLVVVLLASLAAVLLVVVALGAALPGNWAVRRSVLIAAAPEQVHGLVGDLRRWPQWAFWGRQPPRFRFSFEGTAGPEQTLHWQELQGAKRLAGGSITLTRSHRSQGVEFSTHMPEGKSGSGSVSYEQLGDMTRVSWLDQGQLPPIVGGLFLDLYQQRLGRHMQKGLAQLKRVSEAAPAPP